MRHGLLNKYLNSNFSELDEGEKNEIINMDAERYDFAVIKKLKELIENKLPERDLKINLDYMDKHSYPMDKVAQRKEYRDNLGLVRGLLSIRGDMERLVSESFKDEGPFQQLLFHVDELTKNYEVEKQMHIRNVEMSDEVAEKAHKVIDQKDKGFVAVFGARHSDIVKFTQTYCDPEYNLSIVKSDSGYLEYLLDDLAVNTENKEKKVLNYVQLEKDFLMKN